jgi:aminomethyltransferase
VVNAANREKDAAWIKDKLAEIKPAEVNFKDISDSLAQIALQGPAAPAILSSISNTIPAKYYTLIEKGNAAGIDCIVSRTGYTGETGFELYCKPDDAITLWEKIMEAGKSFGLIPCGLGARDTLRLEASMPLYGHEMDETITPFEAGLASAVKMNKPFFIGKEALTGKEKPGRIRTGLKITDRGIARENCPVLINGKNIGKTTSGTFCPYLKAAMAMALLDSSIAAPGNIVDVDVRGRLLKAEICALPFFRSKSFN